VAVGLEVPGLSFCNKIRPGVLHKVSKHALGIDSAKFSKSAVDSRQSVNDNCHHINRLLLRSRREEQKGK
jgi:hypothetical protein